MSQNLIGQTILNRYYVHNLIGAGGMSVVYLVWDKKRNIPMAMKVLQTELSDDPTAYKSFQREAESLYNLKQKNIVPFYGLFSTDDIVFLLEGFIQGESLKTILVRRQGKPISIPTALTYLKALCAALNYAHSNEIIHCDLKPANVLVDTAGNIYLTDFGIARYSESVTTTLAGAGTPAYMAPEQIRGEKVSPATDIYSLGVMLYEMLTGRRPFSGSEPDLISTGSSPGERIRVAHQRMQPPDPRTINPEIPHQLAVVIKKALAKSPHERFQDAGAFFMNACQAAGIGPERIPEAVHPLTTSSSTGSSIKPEGGSRSNESPHPDKAGTQRKAAILLMSAIGVILCLSAVVVLGFQAANNKRSMQDHSTAIARTSTAQASEISQDWSFPQPTDIPLPGDNQNKISGNNNRNAFPITDVPATNKPVSKVLATHTIPPLPTQKPTNTQRPTSTPVQVDACPGAKPTKIKVGIRVIVCTEIDGLLAKAEPKSGVKELFRLYPFKRYERAYKVVSGPVCENGDTRWWQVLIKEGTLVYEGLQYLNDSRNLEEDTKVWLMDGGDSTDPNYICPEPEP